MDVWHMTCPFLGEASRHLSPKHLTLSDLMAQAALENEEEAALRWTPDGFLLWNPRGFGYRLGDTQMAPKLALVLPSNHSVGYWLLAISWYIMTGDFLSHGGTPSHHPFLIGMKTMKTIKTMKTNQKTRWYHDLWDPPPPVSRESRRLLWWSF